MARGRRGAVMECDGRGEIKLVLGRGGRRQLDEACENGKEKNERHAGTS